MGWAIFPPFVSLVELGDDCKHRVKAEPNYAPAEPDAGNDSAKGVRALNH